MRDRLELHDIFEDVLGSDNVYFQPPETKKLLYPCVIYNRDRIDSKKANDLAYINTNRYSVTVIDIDPDSLIPGKILGLPLCNFERHFTKDNLNHDIFTLYF